MKTLTRAPRISRKESTFHAVLEKVVDNFTPRADLTPFRVPNEPVDLAEILPAYFDPENGAAEPLYFLRHSDNTTLLNLDWSGSPGCSSGWTLDAITLPSRRRVFIAMSDYGQHVLAATGPMFRPEDADRPFLRLLAKDNGDAFGTGVVGSAPSSVLSDVDDQEFWVEFFTQAFDAQPDCWEGLELEGFDYISYDDLPAQEQADLRAEFDRRHPELSDDVREAEWEDWVTNRLIVPRGDQVRRWLNEAWR